LLEGDVRRSRKMSNRIGRAIDRFIEASVRLLYLCEPTIITGYFPPNAVPLHLCLFASAPSSEELSLFCRL